MSIDAVVMKNRWTQGEKVQFRKKRCFLSMIENYFTKLQNRDLFWHEIQPSQSKAFLDYITTRK